MTATTGGRMRCEIIQNRMSPLPTVRWKRRPSARASSTKIATATAAAIRQSTPQHADRDRHGEHRQRRTAAIVPNFGRYSIRASA